MSDRIANISPEHFSWLVEGRSANQQSTLELYRIIVQSEKKLNSNVELQDAAHELTGVAFSLWRAVFLSDVSEEYLDELADIKKFLVSLISDNTVLYITDKNARNWSFRYYLRNAQQRLKLLSESKLSLVDASDLLVPAETDKDDWASSQKILDEAIRRFGAAIE
ncbi:hypothetical protein [Methylobacterium platani]|uniref:hypothetical protein n=1 Tax=Methylobacterium platani TaxID=427683 RepID=UPI000B30F4EF|nr:hypothetical protein [Methylobacterium platani]